MKIYTAYRPPPIPTRSCDWQACEEDYEPGRPQGFGATEAEAIENLLQSCSEQFEEWFLDRYNRWPLDDGYADGWDEWISELDIERIP